MSAPRWTLTGLSLPERIIRRDGEQALLLRPAGTVDIPELTSLARRIVALLNATELTSDAVAALQVCVMEAGQLRGDRPDAEMATLDALTDTLNHTVRMYVELNEEASIALDEH